MEIILFSYLSTKKGKQEVLIKKGSKNGNRFVLFALVFPCDDEYSEVVSTWLAF